MKYSILYLVLATSFAMAAGSGSLSTYKINLTILDDARSAAVNSIASQQWSLNGKKSTLFDYAVQKIPGSRLSLLKVSENLKCAPMKVATLVEVDQSNPNHFSGRASMDSEFKFIECRTELSSQVGDGYLDRTHARFLIQVDRSQYQSNGSISYPNMKTLENSLEIFESSVE